MSMNCPKCNLPPHGKELHFCFICFVCGCHQGYDDDGTYGGITEQEALKIGWLKVKDENWKWLCPKCSGNEDKLNQIFNQFFNQ